MGREIFFQNLGNATDQTPGSNLDPNYQDHWACAAEDSKPQKKKGTPSESISGNIFMYVCLLF